MGNKDPRVDAYIEKSADFARPILKHLRAVVHEACPEVVETIKWSAPTFEYHGLLCGMAAFKAHCTFGFWKAQLLALDGKPLVAEMEGGAEQFGRLTTVRDLPGRRVLVRLVKQAARLNEEGIKVPAKPRAAKRRVAVPDDLRAALGRRPAARAAFEAFSPSHQREYVEWLEDARREETRRRRLATAIEWLAEGKPRNWKYIG
jgi:uncharacterized protein YdeI (YjbR/CyaY-like superfamily)